VEECDKSKGIVAVVAVVVAVVEVVAIFGRDK